MQSVHCVSAPVALHTWAPSGRIPPPKFRRGGGNLIANDLSMKSSSSGSRLGSRKMLGTRSTSSESRALNVPRATLAVEKDSEPRKEKEKRVAGVQESTTKFAPAKKEQDLQSDKGLREGPHGTVDYLRLLPEFFKEDGGPPRWFCPVQKSQQAPAPLLLCLPGILGVVAGLSFHYETLGRLFELRCLHVPISDRTPFEGLVSLVENTVREEARQSPGRPIYLFGDNIGGAVALAVAAQNPRLDLVLVLVNLSTSFDRSTLDPFLPVLQALPQQVFAASPFLLGFLLAGDLSQSSSNKFASTLPPFQNVQAVSEILQGCMSAMPTFVSSFSKETVLWNLQLLSSSVRYTNSRLHRVKAEVLILVSKRDQLLLGLQEARRLSKTLPNCTYRQFEQSSHSLLLEEDFDLASVIKSTGMYRQTGLKDPVANFAPPTEEEVNKLYDSTKLVRRLVSPVFFSTGDDGKVVQGLSMIPTKGPIIFVGYHSFLGLDMKIIATEMLKTRQLLMRGLGHPILFDKELLEEAANMIEGDLGRLFGAVPVSGRNMFKLLARGDNVALYPGGAREALHRKGEAYKLFWPHHPEFVKMAAKFGATIIPMCTVGEDDQFEILVDYDDMTSIPVLGDWIVDFYKQLPQLRSNLEGEVSKQALHMPLIAPKLSGPGRMYLLFGQPIYTEGKREYFRDQSNVNATYRQLKREVEAGMSYLLTKREEDPYRSFLPRLLCEASSGGETQAPTFKPE